MILLLAAIVSLVGVIYIAYFSSKNIDHLKDELLFSAAKGSTVTEYYSNIGECGSYLPSSVPQTITLSGTKKRWLSIGDAPQILTDAFIAVEDREFYEHNGVNLRRTLYAMLNTVFHFRSTFGASTITQQVVKNISGDKDVTLKRKLSEMIRAYNIEKNHSKSEILELYINIIPMGEGIEGVNMAAEIYFGKSADALSAAECATLVGITNAPTRYNHHINPDACVKKRNEVLAVMRSEEKLSDSEYLSAINAPIGVLPLSSRNEAVYSWFVETVNCDVVAALKEKYGMSESAATALLYAGGLKIYTTENKKMQEALYEYFSTNTNFPSQIKSGLNYSMVICDSMSGDLLAIVGSQGEKQGNRLLNQATVSHVPGSALKPLALYAPLIDEGDINAATVFDDVPQEFFENNGYIAEYPHNYPNVYQGLITVKDALRLSKNTVAIRLYKMLGAERIYRSLKYDFGFDTLVRHEEKNNGTVTDLAPSPLALGQLTYGVSLRKLTEAYTVFPSEGVKHGARSFVKVLAADGSVLLENKVDDRIVFSKYGMRVMNTLLSNVVDSGTASAIRLKYTVDTAGKTGTSGDDKDRLFIGYTPYLTAGIWCGYDGADKAIGRLSVSHLKIWDEVMQNMHTIVTADNGEITKNFSTAGLVYREFCRDSGNAYSSVCELDPRSNRCDSAYFTPDNQPGVECGRHVLCYFDEGEWHLIGNDQLINSEEYEIAALVNAPERNFPKEIVISDNDYVYRSVNDDTGLENSEEKRIRVYHGIGTENKKCGKRHKKQRK
jgi:penicillin-binding protein 1A